MGKILNQDTEAYMLLRNRIFTLNDRHIAPEKLEWRAREREKEGEIYMVYLMYRFYMISFTSSFLSP